MFIVFEDRPSDSPYVERSGDVTVNAPARSSRWRMIPLHKEREPLRLEDGCPFPRGRRHATRCHVVTIANEVDWVPQPSQNCGHAGPWDRREPWKGWSAPVG
jgi:hypothetical protein